MPMMKCTIDPEFTTLDPASIPGPGGKVTIGFTATTETIGQLQVTYEILESKDYKFSPMKFTIHKVGAGGSSATRIWNQVPDGSDSYEEQFLIEPKAGSTGGEASLKIVASVLATKGKWELDPVHAFGSLAILSGTLRSLMEKTGAAKGGGTFKQQALQFVRDRIKSLDSDPKFKKFLADKEITDFKWPVDETIVNALAGDTASRQSTIDALKPAIEYYKGSGLIKKIKKADFLKAGGAKLFKGVLNLSSKKPV